jgi:hypothetical protein
MGDVRHAYMVLMGKPEGKIPLKTRHECNVNIKMDIRGLEWGVMYCIHLAQDRNQCQTHIYLIMNLRVP